MCPVTRRAALSRRLVFVATSDPVVRSTAAPLGLVLRVLSRLVSWVTPTHLWIPDWGPMCRLAVVVAMAVTVRIFRLARGVSEGVLSGMRAAQRRGG